MQDADSAVIFIKARASNSKTPSLSHFADKKWLAILTYLIDMFEKLNDLNLSLQDQKTNILILSDEVKAFIMKTGL
jgi:hypothetical protein